MTTNNTTRVTVDTLRELDCIRVITGAFNYLIVDEFSDTPRATFATDDGSPFTIATGLVYNPEGEKDNSAPTLVQRVKDAVSNGFSGIVFTNAMHVFDAFSVYSTAFNRTAMFFKVNSADDIEDITGSRHKFWDDVAAACGTLKGQRYNNEHTNDEE